MLVAPGIVPVGIVGARRVVGGRGCLVVGNTRSSRHQPREGSKGVDGTRLPSNRENCHPGGSANRIVGCAHRTPILPVPRAPTDVFIYYICDWVGKYSRLDRESVCHFENERRASLRVTAAAAAAFVVVVVVVVVVVAVAVVVVAAAAAVAAVLAAVVVDRHRRPCVR